MVRLEGMQLHNKKEMVEQLVQLESEKNNMTDFQCEDQQF